MVDEGTRLKNAGKIDAAVEMYRKAIDRYPDIPAAYYNLGVVLAEQKRFDIATKMYDRALELKPDHIEALCNLGMRR